ncbi:MAG: hypothetical protein DSM106950_46505 [Stigonema ocellatum SAG 48.90 = DSM 106950]|nr:hypothetical protein [Stigonema ocellatum SAG 48.90 = DSM 106950]
MEDGAGGVGDRLRGVGVVGLVVTLIAHTLNGHSVNYPYVKGLVTIC